MRKEVLFYLKDVMMITNYKNNVINIHDDETQNDLPHIYSYQIVGQLHYIYQTML